MKACGEKDSLKLEAHTGASAVPQAPRADDFNGSWPTRFYGRDKYGHTLIAEKLEDLHLGRINKEYKQEQVSHFRVQQLEYIAHLKTLVSKDIGKTVYKHVHIMDLAGLKMSHFSGESRALVQKVLGVANEHYPESLFALYVTNAPMIFRGIWSVIRVWLHPITQKKVNITSGNPKSAMMKDGIPLESIPDWLGGTNKGALFYDELNKYQAAETAKAKEEAAEKKKATEAAEVAKAVVDTAPVAAISPSPAAAQPAAASVNPPAASKTTVAAPKAQLVAPMLDVTMAMPVEEMDSEVQQALLTVTRLLKQFQNMKKRAQNIPVM
ncbi:hypothetical protein CYMTET_54393 [Cymbomonas tetramitiformis]|uniref:CRAL-TRIO domain-containing protein n=1 Tax=Cymbomonas tetramitiformis TaxID=36881 RepID=A0AAE0BGS9_9CHLO|nr:hypothetical protein CYMTET_54393 [Cymbomonas tetramitiformis]